jgi:hypothetical protein
MHARVARFFLVRYAHVLSQWLRLKWVKLFHKNVFFSNLEWKLSRYKPVKGKAIFEHFPRVYLGKAWSQNWSHDKGSMLWFFCRKYWRDWLKIPPAILCRKLIAAFRRPFLRNCAQITEGSGYNIGPSTKELNYKMHFGHARVNRGMREV